MVEVNWCTAILRRVFTGREFAFLEEIDKLNACVSTCIWCWKFWFLKCTCTVVLEHSCIYTCCVDHSFKQVVYWTFPRINQPSWQPRSSDASISYISQHEFCVLSFWKPPDHRVRPNMYPLDLGRRTCYVASNSIHCKTDFVVDAMLITKLNLFSHPRICALRCQLPRAAKEREMGRKYPLLTSYRGSV